MSLQAKRDLMGVKIEKSLLAYSNRLIFHGSEYVRYMYIPSGLYNGIPPWAVNPCQQLNTIQLTMENQNNRWQYVENHIAEQNQKMIKMESQLSDIANIKREMSSACTNILGIQTEMKTIKTKMSDYDNTLQQYSDMCDDLTTNNSKVDSRVNLIYIKIQDINQKQQETCEKRTDIQWRSMRDNHIFSEIPEERQFREKRENCEEVIQSHISTELQIPDQISIDRAHRLGKFNPRHAYL